MGTNYYAEWNLSPRSDGPAALEVPATKLRLHICKSHASFQGRVFNSWSAWKNFLESNEWQITIRDEYGAVHEVRDFIRDAEEVPADRRAWHHRWLVDHHYPLTDDWLDDDGFSFHRGEFY